MKLGRIFALTSVLALSAATVACGDDEGDPASGDDDVAADDDASDDDASDDDAADDDASDDDMVEPEPADDDMVEPEPADDDMVEPEPADDDVVEPEPADDDMVEPEPADDDMVEPEPADDDVVEPEPADDDMVEPEPTPDDDAGAEPEPEPEPTCTTPEAAELPDEPDCPAIDDRDFIEVSGEIGDTEWDCNTNVYLTGLTYVVDGTLTIGPGTYVFGEAESALVITRGSEIDASGTPDSPIVFTSSAAEGERASADWGGVVLLGDAPINVEGGENPIEGIDPTEDNGVYGGSDPDGSCGTLRYARIEFAGFLFGEDNELNALTVGGCGSGTTIDYVQTHRGADDGVEMFGGTADIKHILVTGTADDSLDWDQGWQGRVQNLAIVQIEGGSDSGFEADNLDGANDSMPRSMPTMYNFTIAGGGTGAGMVLRRGTWGQLYNGVVMGMPGAGVDFRDEATVAGTEDGSLTVSNSIFWENGEDYSTDSEEDNDGNFDEEAYLSHADRANQQENPALGAAAFDLSGPDLVPPASSPAAEGGATPPDDGFFNTCATYIGAFEPGGDDWTAGWTDFPEN
jgi:hypothetical protein